MLFCAFPFPQDVDVSQPSQLGRRVQVFLAHHGWWEGAGGKTRVSSAWFQHFITREEWLRVERALHLNLHLWGICQRLVSHKVCWAAEQDKFKSCLLLNWYWGLSWAAAGDDGCSPFWFCFVQVMTLCPWLLFAAVDCLCSHSLWADCSCTEKTRKGWASIITAWQGLRIRPGTWNQSQLHSWITDVARCPCWD